LKRTAI